MPKIYANDLDKYYMREIRSLKREVTSYGITNKEIGDWIGCSGQNIGQLWKTGGFSYKQIFIIQEKLKMLKERYGL